MKVISSLAIVAAAALAGCGGSDGVSSTPEAPATLSIGQLKAKATFEFREAEVHLQASMKAYNPRVSHGEQVEQLKLSAAARQRGNALRRQLCELVLQDPRTPHNDQLGMIANMCE